MKLQVISFPNPDIKDIHLNKSLLKFAFREDGEFSIMGIRKGNPILAKRLKAIKGVTEVGISDSSESKYELTIQKGRLFDWDEILKKAIKTIHEVVAPKEKLEQLEDSYNE